MDKGKKRLFILLGMASLLVYGAVFGGIRQDFGQGKGMLKKFVPIHYLTRLFRHAHASFEILSTEIQKPDVPFRPRGRKGVRLG